MSTLSDGRARGKSDATAVRDALRLLVAPGAVVELRVLNTPRAGTVSGYFNDLDKLAHAAAQWSGNAPAVYFTLNPVNPALLARASNRVAERAKSTTGDRDILRRRWFFIDFDPRRPAGISATDAEHQAALERSQHCRDWLGSMGWPSPVEADSGNGGHLDYLIDLPNDEASAALLQRCLQALAFQFSDDRVDVDCTTYNAARICKLYGTLTCKGDNIADRPHRLSRVLAAPDPLVTVPNDLLEALAALLPDPEPGHQAHASQDNGRVGSFDLERWIADHNLPVASSGPWNDGGKKWVLNPCPWNPDHDNRAAYIVRLRSGAIAAGCHHNGCAGKDWGALRDLFEPGWRDRRQPTAASGASPKVAVPSPSWPDPPAPEAFFGLAGRIVRTIEPASEAHPAALLVQTLVAFGNALGRSAHFIVEADRHHGNEFVVLIGRTSKARKGTSWGRINRLFLEAEEAWAKDRVQTGASSGEGIIWAVRDPIIKRERVKEQGEVHYKEIEADPGIDDKRLLINEPEFATVLKQTERQGNTLSAILRQGWDGLDLRTLTKNSPTRATGAHVSLIGHITADELRRYLTETEAANGYGNRHMWICTDRSKRLPEGGQVDPFAWEGLRNELAEALAFARSVGEVKRDDEARGIWCDIYGQLSEGKPGLAGALLARAEAHVMRLAMLYAVMDRSAEIQAPHLLAALALWEYVERSVYFVFGDQLGDPVADDLLRLLRSCPDGLTRSDLTNYLGRHQSSDRIGRALGLLLQHRLARCERQETGGRPAERWFAGSRAMGQ
jgi:hypothetical protein